MNILLVSETHILKYNFIIPNYRLSDKKYPDGSSGSLIQNLMILKFTMSWNTSISNIDIVVKWGDPPRFSIPAEYYQNVFNTLNRRLIVAGDFNVFGIVSVPGQSKSRPGEKHSALPYQRDLTCHQSLDPTYWPTDHCKIPDLSTFEFKNKPTIRPIFRLFACPRNVYKSLPNVPDYWQSRHTVFNIGSPCISLHLRTNMSLK